MPLGAVEGVNTGKVSVCSPCVVTGQQHGKTLEFANLREHWPPFFTGTLKLFIEWYMPQSLYTGTGLIRAAFESCSGKYMQRLGLVSDLLVPGHRVPPTGSPCTRHIDVEMFRDVGQTRGWTDPRKVVQRAGK